MRSFLVLLLTLTPLMIFAERITMDLATATNLMGDTVAYSERVGECCYDLTHVWDSTYSDAASNQFIYTNDGRFMLSHIPSQNSYDGWSWEGFTLSKVSQDTANVFGCVASGGMVGVGSPYVVGYYSEWVSEDQGYSSNVILFDQEYYPEYVCICQNSNTMEAISNGNVYNARAFTERDTLTLIIAGLTSTYDETDTLHYHLAIHGEKNNAWVKVPLTVLGKVAGLSFRMTTTDVGEFGANTPLYFALDGLTVSTEPSTALPHVNSFTDDTRCKIMCRGQLSILHQGAWYDLFGRRIQ